MLREARAREAPCVRCDPTHYGLNPSGAEMRALAAACGRLGLPVLTAVRLEDIRQRHPNDGAAELSPAAVRALVRADPRVRLIITHADRDFIEQVHFGSTPGEAARILWDIAWIWGPPEDHLELLLRTVGVERFAFGTGMPLRLPEASVAKLDLLDLGPGERERHMEIELACRFYAKGWLSLGQGARMAHLDRYTFGAELAERGIPRQYGPEDLDADLRYGSG